MMTIKTAIEYLNNNATDEVFWLGQVDIEQIDSLEDNLGIKLPHDFREFLLLVGGGGVIGEEISGIVNNNALEESGGAVFTIQYIAVKNFHFLKIILLYI